MEELVERAARDLENSIYAIALTGAGIPASSGEKPVKCCPG